MINTTALVYKDISSKHLLFLAEDDSVNEINCLLYKVLSSGVAQRNLKKAST